MSPPRLAILLLGLVSFAFAAEPQRPGLLFREDWKETPAATPLTQEHVANPDLILTRHGPAEAEIKKSHHDRPADDPYYVWSGDTKANWAISLRHRASLVDLTGQAKIRWRAKQSGFRQLRIILKLADGRWVISDPVKVAEGRWAQNVDLGKVDEIGCTDLMSGGGTPASSRLDWLEVYARAVQR